MSNKNAPFPTHPYNSATPNSFKQIIYNVIGQKWKNMRATLSPAFTSSKMKTMFNLVSECGVQLGDFLQKCINDINMKIKDCQIERGNYVYQNDMDNNTLFLKSGDHFKTQVSLHYKFSQIENIP